MKSTIFTIALLFGTTIVFSQETPTSKHAINTKGTAATNGRMTTTNADANQGKTFEIEKTKTKSNNANEIISPEAVLTTEKKHTKSGHVTLLK